MMKYLKYIVCALLLTVAFSDLQAQTDSTNTWEQRKKQYKADKIAYISMEMGFTVDEAQKFWPVYNKYDAKYDELFCQRRQAYNGRKLEQMTDAECATAMDKLGELDRMEMQTHREYETELRQLFPAKFVLRYFTAESDFKRKAVNRPKYHGQLGQDYKNQK
ncbi:MAG: hypothetical protein IKS00_00320 [Bacteroidales bacterium]|nr:hypothetical protein [Bacteroidales bacterium]